MGSQVHSGGETVSGDFSRKPGDRVGNYELQQPLGFGRFAEVWKAYDVGMNRVVALKIFFDRIVRQRTSLPVVVEELWQQAPLDSERIVSSYDCQLDISEGHGPYYIAMKWMEGGTLQKMLEKRGRLPVNESVGIIAEVIQGLRVIHSAGFIHRDISPSNILFDATGQAAISDFGIVNDANQRGTIIAGSTVGKANYMSPEQGEGRPVNTASDIYSLGTVLHEMLTGELPFSGSSDTAIILARGLHHPPPLHEIAPEVPERLSKVVLKCLEPDLKNRYPDCDALVLALDQAMSEQAIIERARSRDLITSLEQFQSKRSLNKAVLVGAAVGLVALGFLARQVLDHKAGPADAANASRASESQAQLQAIEDWGLRPWNDPIFRDCRGYVPCMERANHAKVVQNTDWRRISFDAAILNDCMAFHACIERKMHADQLSFVADWSKLSDRDKPLLNDCMGMRSCEAARVAALAKPRTPPALALPKPAQPQEGADEPGVGAQGAGKIFGHN